MLNVRLHRARKAAGLSLRDLSERIGISRAAMKKYEDGLAMPASDILVRLSLALNVPAEYFFRPDSVALEGIEYRKRTSLPKKRLGAITHEVNDQIERRIELESLFPQPPVSTFAPFDELPAAVTEMDHIETMAERVRASWDLGLHPIPDLIDVLETNGVRVFMIEADEENKFDGLAARVNGMPIVVVGRRWPRDRQRFTLAHKLGHLELQGRLPDSIDEEAACNRFAGAFLFPRASVLQEVGVHRNAIELKELALLKQEFGISMAAILDRARDLGIVSQAYREQQAKLFRRKGWYRREPGRDFPPQKAHVFEQLVFHALAEEYIGESKAAELMNMPLRLFRRVRSIEGGDARSRSTMSKT